MISKNSCILFGQRSIIEYIQSGNPINKIYLQNNKKNIHFEKIIQLSLQYQIPVQKVPLVKLNQYTKKNHQGVVAQTSPVRFHTLSNIIQNCYEKGKDPLLIILDQITDVRNFGAIARTALATHVDAIILPFHHASAINEDAMKTSAGALAYMPICREKKLSQTITYLINSGIQIIACHEKSTRHLYQQQSLTGPLAIIMGAEDQGITQAYISQAQQEITIPIFGPIDALNVSVATAVVLYEVIRQRKFSH